MIQETPYSLASAVNAYFVKELGEQIRGVGLEPMADGHAGRTFAFDLFGPQRLLGRCILKLGPVGIRRSGSADIHRQVPLLRVLASTGLPVPRVFWSSEREDDLGVPFLVMERLAGRSYIVWDPDPAFLQDMGLVERLWNQGVHQGVGFMLADNEMDLHNSQLAIFHADWLLDRQDQARNETSMVTVSCSEALCRVVDRSLQILGSIGIAKDQVVERISRDIKPSRIYDGPSEVHRHILAQRLAANGPFDPWRAFAESRETGKAR